MTDRRLLAPVAKLMLDAADHIEQHGHTKGQLYGRGSSACIMGALIHVAKGDNVEWLVSEAEAHLCDYLHVDCIMRWNDASYRKAAAVIAALRNGAAAYVGAK